MRDLPRVRPARWIAILLLTAAGCARVEPPPVAPPPVIVPAEPLTPAEVGFIAELLRLEDRRDFQEGVFAAAAASAEAPVRASAALAAARIGGSPSRAFVRDLLQDGDTLVAAAAAFGAGQLRDTAAVPLLVEMLDTARIAARPTVAAEAAAALGRIGTEEARSTLARFLLAADTATATRGVIDAALIGAWRAGETATAPFGRWLSSGNAETRWRAAYGLTRRLRPEAVELLLPALEDTEPLVRAYAIRGLTMPLVTAAGVDPTLVQSRLLTALDDSAYTVGIEATRALGTYPNEASVAALLQQVEAGAPHEVAVALEALGAIGTAALPASDSIRRMAERTTAPEFIRETAVAALIAMDPTAAPGLLERLSTDSSWRVRAAVARALGESGRDALTQLGYLARDPDPRVAAAAIQAAIAVLDAGSRPLLRPLLIESLQSPDVLVRAAALEGLSLLADATLFPLLLDAYARAASDAQNDAALAAIDALAELELAGSLVPHRAFFTRFRRPTDHLVRQRALERFEEAALAAWGESLPIETTSSPADYQQFVEQWMAPVPDERSLPLVRIDTDLGSIDVVLFGDRAPLTVASFLRLVHEGFFDGQEWPRVVPNFVLQGGDPRGDTSGGPGFSIRDEINRVRYVTGTLGMALSGPDTGGSQFFITHSPQPHLDGGYTVFGRVVAGQDVVERILPGQRIISVREIVEVL